MRLVTALLVLLISSPALAAVNDTACAGAATDYACVTLDYGDLSGTLQTNLAAYYGVFTAAPEIASAIPYRTLPQAYRAAIWAEFETARTSGGVPAQTLPSGSQPEQDWDDRPNDVTSRRVYLSEAETIDLLAARMAHAFYLEVNALVPWSLLTYEPEWFDDLFRVVEKQVGGIDDGYTDSMLNNWTPLGAATGTTLWPQPNPHYAELPYVIDYDPSSTMATTLLLTGTLTTQWAAIEDILEFETTFSHGSIPTTPEVAAPPEAYLVKYTSTTTGVVTRYTRGGCAPMSFLTQSFLRSINIPLGKLFGRYYGGGHTSYALPSIGKVVQHGDVPYESQYRNQPVMDRLVPYSAWKEFVIPKLPENLGGPSGNSAATKLYTNRLEALAVWGDPPGPTAIQWTCGNFDGNFQNYLVSFDACEETTVVRELCVRGRLAGNCPEAECPGD